MANVDLIEGSYTQQLNYFLNGSNIGTFGYTLDPTGNPVVFKFESDIIGTEQASSIQFGAHDFFLGTNQDLPAGSTYTIYGETFTASDQPTEANEYFSCHASSTQELLLCINSLADAINQNQNLNWRFNAQPDFSGSIARIHLRAKYSGSAYDLDPFNTDKISTNLTYTVNFYGYTQGQDGSRGQLLQDFSYGVWLEIWKYDGSFEWNRKLPLNSNASLITTLSQKWNATNEFVFDIAKYLKQLTYVDIDSFNDTTSATLFKHIPSATAPYYIRYGEEFNGGYDLATDLPIDESTNIEHNFVRRYTIGSSDDRWTSAGQFPLNINNPYPLFHPYWQSIVFGSTDYKEIRVLTNQPQYKLRRRNKFNNTISAPPEFIFFYYYNDQKYSQTRQLRVKTIFHYVDGTVESPIFTHITAGDLVSGLYVINLSLTSLGFWAYDSAKAILFTEHIIEQNITGTWSSYCEPIYYDIDLNTEASLEDQNKIYFPLFWRNKYGVIDTFTFEGLKDEKISTKPLNYTQSFKYQADYQRDKFISSTYQVESEKVVTLQTGWVDEEHYRWLQELLISPELWRISKYELFGTDQYDIVETDMFESVQLIDHTWELQQDAKIYNLTLNIKVSTPENKTIQNGS